MIASPDHQDSGDAPEYHCSPDGLLALTVVDDSEREQTVRFHGFDWHTDASTLAELTGLSPEEAVRGFVDDVLHDRSLIAVLTIDGEVDDVWVTDSPESDLQFMLDGEQLQFRYWSGRSYAPQSPTS